MPYKKLKLWFDLPLATQLTQQLRDQGLAVDMAAVLKHITDKIEDLELKGRIELIADAWHLNSAADYPHIIRSMLAILGPENEKETGMFLDYYWIMPIAKYIEKYGLNHHALSMAAIEEVTKRNTGEYSIRPYLLQDPSKTLAQMHQWALSSNKHVRRLASEGVRPRLPWATKLQPYIDNPSPILPILDLLKDDPSKYVQKSVANCVNDILKDNRPTAEKLLYRWSIDAPTPQRIWIIKHAIRNLRKNKDPWLDQLPLSQ